MSKRLNIEPSMWTRLPEKRLERSRFPGIEILAKEISRAREHHPRHALLLGAGASVTSGIRATATLIGDWRHCFFQDRRRSSQTPGTAKYSKEFEEWLEKPENGQSQYEIDAREWEQLHEKHPSEYAFLFSFIASRPTSRQEFIEREVENKEPGPGYIYLASLIRVGRFRTVLTTNFDDLIHDALFRYADMKPAVCAFDSQITSIHPNTARPTIVKLHGDFMYSNMRNVGSEVQHLSLNMRDKLYQTCKSNGLIVIGYGGGDESIMMPLSAMLHDGSFLDDGLHWCLHCPKDAKDVVIPGEVWRLYESHPARVKLYCTDGFDHAMELVFRECRCEPPPDLARPRERSLFQRLHKSLQATDERYRVSSHFNSMLKAFLLGDHEERPWYAHDLDLADYHFCTGRWAQRAKAYDKAIEELQESLKYCDGVITPTFSADDNLHPPPDLTAIVRAYRRYSGCITQQADALLHKQKMSPPEADLTPYPAIRDSVANIAIKGFESAQNGLKHGRDKPECHDNMRALVYNALLSLGYERLALGQPLPPSRRSEYKQLKKDLHKYDVGERDWQELMTNEFGYYLIEEDIVKRDWLEIELGNEGDKGEREYENMEMRRGRVEDKDAKAPSSMANPEIGLPNGIKRQEKGAQDKKSGSHDKG